MPIKVTAALITQKDKALLCRRAPGEKLAGYWEFPGGKVEAGEGDRECLRRELLEELGLAVEVGEFVCSHSHQYPEFSITLVLYAAFGLLVVLFLFLCMIGMNGFRFHRCLIGIWLLRIFPLRSLLLGSSVLVMYD